MMFRHVFRMFLACVALTITTQAAHADSILNDLMPSVFGAREKGPKPEETLIAPFAQNTQGTRTAGQQATTTISHDSAIAVDTAHRSDAAVSEWAIARIVMGLTYDPTDTALLKSRDVDLTDGFAPTGRADLDAALGKMNVPQALISTHQKIAAFTTSNTTASSVADIPPIKYSGQYNGVYRWVIDVPVALSVMPVTLKNYQSPANRAAANVTTTPLTIRVQIARVIGDATHPDGMVIERFTVMAASS